MNKPTYTLAECRAINQGWTTLIAFAESHGAMDDDRRLHEALSDERRQTQDVIAAKALLLDEVLAAGDVERPVLWSMRTAHRDVIAYSWQMHEACRQEVSDPKRTTWGDVLQAATESSEMYRQARERFFQKLALTSTRH